MNASPAVTPSSDGAIAPQATLGAPHATPEARPSQLHVQGLDLVQSHGGPAQGYGPRPAEELEDAPTIEFAPGLRRPISLGTPPPPPTHLYEARLGRLEPRPGSRRLRMLVPVVAAGLVVAAIGVGLTLRGEAPGPGPSAPVARTTFATPDFSAAASAAAPVESTAPSPAPSTEPATTPTQTRGSAVAPPPDTPADPVPTVTVEPPAPTLAGPGTVPFGQSVFLNAGGFPCGAGAQVSVTIVHAGSEFSVFDGASLTDAQGGATVRVIVLEVDSAPGQVAVGAGPPNYATLSPGEWTVRVTNPAQAGCTRSATATANVTIL